MSHLLTVALLLQWLNSLIAEIWPFVDKGICQMIKVRTDSVQRLWQLSI